MVRDILMCIGYKVLAATNGEEGVDLAAQHSGGIDLVLTDVVMPKMDGREMVRKIAAARPDVKVLYISGYTEHAAAIRDTLGDAVFLGKPFTPGALTRKVREILDEL